MVGRDRTMLGNTTRPYLFGGTIATVRNDLDLGRIGWMLTSVVDDNL
jgi:hypothetical protein